LALSLGPERAPSRPCKPLRTGLLNAAGSAARSGGSGGRQRCWRSCLPLALLFWLRTALSHRFVRFPAEAAAGPPFAPNARLFLRWPAGESTWACSTVTPSCRTIPEVPFTEILRVLQATGTDFICLSDHCDEARRTSAGNGAGCTKGNCSFRDSR